MIEKYRNIPGEGQIIITDTASHCLGQNPNIYKRILIQNRALSDSGDATSGNALLLGTENRQIYEIPQGENVELIEISPMRLFCKVLGSASGETIVAWLAFGKVEVEQ